MVFPAGQATSATVGSIEPVDQARGRLVKINK